MADQRSTKPNADPQVAAPEDRAPDRFRPGSPAADETAAQPPADIQTTSGVPAVRIAPAGAGTPVTTPSRREQPATAPGTAEQPDQPGDTADRQPVTVPATIEPPGGHGSQGFAVVALLAGVVGMAALAAPPGPVRLLMLLAFLVSGPGAALMSWSRIRNHLVSVALAVTASMTVACAVAVLTLWTHVWQPMVAVSVLVGTVISTTAVRLVMLGRSAPGPVYPDADDHLGRAVGAAGSRGRGGGAVPIVALLAALALWALALAQFSPPAVTGYGLTAAIGVPFVAAVLLLCVAFALELFGRARVAVLTGGLLAAAAMLHATVPLLYANPEYPWTYKHIGVVDLIRDNGHLTSSTDIYQQWPGFFATMALVSGVAGVDALSFAAWSSLAFALLNMVLLAALLRQFTSNRRVIVLGVLLSQVCMWVDIGYFSPQAFVFTLMLGFWLIVARWLLVSPGPAAAGAGRVARARAGLLHGFPVLAPHSRQTRIVASIAATAVFAAITVSHQLTPFVMLVPAVALAVLGLLRPRLLVLALGLVVIGFVAPRLSTVADQYNILDFGLFSNAAGNAGSWRTEEQQFSALTARTLALAVWAGALFAIWRSRRNPGAVIVPAVIGFAPLVTLFAGNYGGEAIYRVFAFSLPFAALLIAATWLTARRGALLAVTSGVALALAWLAALQGVHGQLVVNRVPTADVQAAEYFYANARPDSSLVLLAPAFPTRLTGNYGSFNRGRTIDVSLVGDPRLAGSLDGSQLPVVENYIRNLGTRDNYLVVSTQMTIYGEYFGLLPPGASRSLQDALNSSPRWLPFYRGPGVTIYQLAPAG